MEKYEMVPLPSIQPAGGATPTTAAHAAASASAAKMARAVLMVANECQVASAGCKHGAPAVILVALDGTSVSGVGRVSVCVEGGGGKGVVGSFQKMLTRCWL